MDLSGQRFEHWLVLPSVTTLENGQRKWLCRCDCGTERYVLERSLIYKESKSCGCVGRKRVTEALAHQLEGQVFGDLKVLHRAEKQKKNGGVWWNCECSCGNLCDVSATLLVKGKKTNCGCKALPKKYHTVDITGQKFNHLTALYPLKERCNNGNVIWHCRCDCGNEIDVSYNVLLYTNMQSCGCQKKKHDEELHTFLTHVDGTSLDIIRSKKLPTDNTSGAKGVYFIRGKWVAKIVFQKKQYHLGSYENKDDAIRVRQEAEQIIFDGAVTHYEKWKKKAEEDPAWAEENPIEIQVSKKTRDELDIVFLPPL